MVDRPHRSRAESCGGPADSREFRESPDVDVKEAFAHRVLRVDAPVAKMAASVHVPNRAPINDAYIAMTTLVRGFTTRLAVDARRLRLDLVADFDDEFYFDSDIEWQRSHAHR